MIKSELNENRVAIAHDKRLGRLNKGERTGKGSDTRLTDFDFFKFTPYADDEKTRIAMQQAFVRAYGSQPKTLGDVRIPVDIAGNFNIHDCQWLYAYKHAPDKPSVFLARSDGESIKKMRDKQGKVKFYYDGERPHDKYTTPNNKQEPCFSYNGRLYPWQAIFKIDLVLVEFNDELARAGLPSYGTVHMSITAQWDRANIIKGYEGAIRDAASLFANPMIAGDFENKMMYLPLRDIPFELSRQVTPITTPPYATKQNPNPDPLSRYAGERSQVRLTLSQKFKASMHKARQNRTDHLLAHVETAFLPQPSQAKQLANVNADLFGDDDGGIDWDDSPESDFVEGEVEPATNGHAPPQDTRQANSPTNQESRRVIMLVRQNAPGTLDRLHEEHPRLTSKQHVMATANMLGLTWDANSPDKREAFWLGVEKYQNIRAAGMDKERTLKEMGVEVESEA